MRMLSLFRRLGLRTQLSVVFAALVVVLTLVLSAGLGGMLRSSAQRDASQVLFTVADNASRQLSQGLFERSRVVQVLSKARGIWEKGLGSQEVRELLARNQAIDPYSLWIGVADSEGNVKSATQGLLEGNSVRERPWFTAGLVDLHVGDVHPAKLLEKLLPPNVSGEPHRFVDFAAPIKLGETTVGVLGMHGSWEWTRDELESLAPTATQDSWIELFVFDREGTLIYSPAAYRSELERGKQRLPVPPSFTDRSKRPAEVASWVDGKSYLTSAVRLQPRNKASDLGWVVVARQPLDVAFAYANRAVNATLVFGGFAALAAVVLAWFAARRLSEDINTLCEAASEVEAGKYGAMIPLVDRNRDVKQLSFALRGMTDRLQTANLEMEKQVHVRTAELEAANRALDLQARTDALTGLLNRRGFTTQIEFAVALATRSGRPLSLVSVDVDYFKRVNDTFGHDAGDEVLRRLAQILEQRVRACDIIGRLGGEEFAVILPDTDCDGARTLAQAIVDSVASQEMPLVGRITVSAGVASFRGKQETSRTLLCRSDAALYDAKAQGRNQVCVEAVE
ncbi:diguanylate cyclase (GGDEF)-like protein [Acidovorax soli]|uniref:diguanylate cyclase n=1 Tax=Acidovorax soli TaxID=592050 RepID=A0A7X0PC58_9BURK|nr:diguanylate cyclase [Acidovorax soli]MBB6558846.1 diguanylate cyclase (GGDEF)-like protein [Acidovorax soli]